MEVYFTRPGEICEIEDRLLNDIKYAKERILIAACYLSEKKIIDAINKCNVSAKYFVLNNNINIENGNMVFLGDEDKSIIMHHKFLIIDNILWVGSFNTSKNAASKNWENCLRITDENIINQYEDEFWKMFLFGKAYKKSIWDVNEKDIYTINCVKCKSGIMNTYEHYTYIVNIVSDVNRNIDNLEGENYNHGVSKERNKRIESYELECVENVVSDKIECQSCGRVDFIKKMSRFRFWHMETKCIHYIDRDEYVEDDSALGYHTEYCIVKEPNKKKVMVSEEWVCHCCMIKNIKEFWKFE